MSDAKVEVHESLRYAVMCSEHGHIGQAYLDSPVLANVIAQKHLENQHQETPPDVVYEEIVLPIREWTLAEMLKHSHGNSEGYDTIGDIIEDTIYKTIGAIGDHG